MQERKSSVETLILKPQIAWFLFYLCSCGVTTSVFSSSIVFPFSKFHDDLDGKHRSDFVSM